MAPTLNHLTPAQRLDLRKRISRRADELEKLHPNQSREKCVYDAVFGYGEGDLFAVSREEIAAVDIPSGPVDLEGLPGRVELLAEPAPPVWGDYACAALSGLCTRAGADGRYAADIAKEAGLIADRMLVEAAQRDAASQTPPASPSDLTPPEGRATGDLIPSSLQIVRHALGWDQDVVQGPSRNYYDPGPATRERVEHLVQAGFMRLPNTQDPAWMTRPGVTLGYVYVVTEAGKAWAAGAIQIPPAMTDSQR